MQVKVKNRLTAMQSGIYDHAKTVLQKPFHFGQIAYHAQKMAGYFPIRIACTKLRQVTDM